MEPEDQQKLYIRNITTSISAHVVNDSDSIHDLTRQDVDGLKCCFTGEEVENPSRFLEFHIVDMFDFYDGINPYHQPDKAIEHIHRTLELDDNTLVLKSGREKVFMTTQHDLTPLLHVLQKQPYMHDYQDNTVLNVELGPQTFETLLEMEKPMVDLKKYAAYVEESGDQYDSHVGFGLVRNFYDSYYDMSREARSMTRSPSDFCKTLVQDFSMLAVADPYDFYDDNKYNEKKELAIVAETMDWREKFRESMRNVLHMQSSLSPDSLHSNWMDRIRIEGNEIFENIAVRRQYIENQIETLAPISSRPKAGLQLNADF